MTKPGESSTFKEVRKGAILLSGVLLAAGLSVPAKLGLSRTLSASPASQATSQEVQKPKYDYMSTFLSRSTQPLGLKEDPALKKMLDQGAVRWAIRAGSRHALD